MASNSRRTLAWMLMHLTQSPEYMRRARAEISALRAHLQATGVEHVSAKTLPSHLPFLHSLLCA